MNDNLNLRVFDKKNETLWVTNRIGGFSHQLRKRDDGFWLLTLGSEIKLGVYELKESGELVKTGVMVGRDLQMYMTIKQHGGMYLSDIVREMPDRTENNIRGHLSFLMKHNHIERVNGKYIVHRGVKPQENKWG